MKRCPARKTLKTLLFVGMTNLFAAGIFLANSSSVLAENLSSDSYIIQFGNFNITAGRKDSSSYSLTDTVGQTGAGPFGEYGNSSYFLGSGFQYIYQAEDFNFTISDLDIDLGTLTPGIHNTGSHSISITTRGGSGYSIFAYELHPLQHESGLVQIADTTCDAANCSETTATVWTNEDIPGFGFTIVGDDTPGDFVNSTYFRQFADQSTAENMQVVMSSDNVATNRNASVTYKAGVLGSLAAGNYQTGIVYVALPGF